MHVYTSLSQECMSIRDEQAIDKLIKSGGATVILVAHRLSTVMNAHKIAVVNSGIVIEQVLSHIHILCTHKHSLARSLLRPYTRADTYIPAYKENESRYILDMPRHDIFVLSISLSLPL